MSSMRVAVAGTCGLALLIVNALATRSCHPFVILSRTVIQVSYDNPGDLLYKLAGVDVVISTISGEAQLALIDAAAGARVRRFVPAEFEGSLASRPDHDFLDRGSRDALVRLAQLQSCGMKLTVFTCGIFYERFRPGGMHAAGIGRQSAIAQEGGYVMDFRHGKAMIPYSDFRGEPVYVCMTSAADVANFVVAALDLPHWPQELRMCGARMTVSELVSVGETLKGFEFERANYTADSLHDELTVARALNDQRRQQRAEHLITTAQGRYDFTDVNLHAMINAQPQPFQSWLAHAWMV